MPTTFAESCISGFLGSDTFRGLQDQDKKYLEYKWKLEWLPEAVAREISTTSYNLMPSESLEALDHYKMIEPKPLPEMEEPLQSHYWISLREKQVGISLFCRRLFTKSVSVVEGSVSRRSVGQSGREAMLHRAGTSETGCLRTLWSGARY